MTVPKTPVNENHSPSANKDEVRLPRQILAMQRKTKTKTMNERAKG